MTMVKARMALLDSGVRGSGSGASRGGLAVVGARRVFLVNVIVDATEGRDGSVQTGGDEVDGLGRVDLALRVFGQCGGRSHDVAAPVGHGVQCAHALGDRVAELAGGVDDLIEDAV